MIISGSIHVGAHGIISLSLWLNNIPLYIFFIHSSIDRHLGCFCILAIVCSAAVDTEVHVSFPLMVFSRHIPGTGIFGSYDSFVFSFMRHLHTVLHSGYTSLQSHKHCRRVIFCPPPIQHVLFLDFLDHKEG